MIIAVTGHRPDKVGGYDLITFGYLVAVAKMSLSWLNPQCVRVGMALGWDMAVAQACYELKIAYTPCIPFKGHECKWQPSQQQMYFDLIQKAGVPPVYVSEPPYAAYKMEIRNRYMIDNCNEILALWNGGQKGGTFNAVNYAKNSGKLVFNVFGNLEIFRNNLLEAKLWQSPHYPVTMI
jgi:uncharacterized phage-like protein YoqJ